MSESIVISVARSAARRRWVNTKMSWDELARKLTTEYHTYETMEEYASLSKDERSEIKDIGGFVGGFLQDGIRKNGHVNYRQILTLDVDYARPSFWEEFTMLYDCEAVIYSTHSYTQASPKLRLVLPLSRKASPDEYEAIGRKLAESLGMEMFDPTTFQPTRMMYWPSTSKDAKFYTKKQNGDWLSVENMLAEYADWSDIAEWPSHPKEKDRIKREHDKQKDPTDKKGVVGAFCKTYSISEAIDAFLTDVYASTGIEGRYTFLKGSTASGLVIYDDIFAYSNHSTDPAGQQLCNAFDLVRIHRFGNLDDEKAAKSGKLLPSFEAMSDWARTLPDVKANLIESTLNDARMDFMDEATSEEEEDKSWRLDLIEEKGGIKACAQNFSLILKNDKALKGKFRQDDFMHRPFVFGSLPWRKIDEPEPVINTDYAGLRNYVETVYNISAPQKIDDAMVLESYRNRYHPIREYITGLTWDGNKRLDTLLIDYFNASDNIYTREAIRKTVVASVARVMKPGIKFDLVPVLVGKEGIGKSTFVAQLGDKWFSDSLYTMHGKEAFEQLQGAWIVELGELAALKKAEVETIKNFISKRTDSFRPAFGHTVEDYPRQCIFFGTTNKRKFLRSLNGDRRFMPIDINESGKKSIFDGTFLKERDQILAEAYELFKAGEKLFLSKDANLLAEKERTDHHEEDSRSGMVEKYLNTLLPENWPYMGLQERRYWLRNEEETLPANWSTMSPADQKTWLLENEDIKARGVIPRKEVCALEIWCECFGRDPEQLNRITMPDIVECMYAIPDWELSKNRKRFQIYGNQQYYVKKIDDELR